MYIYVNIYRLSKRVNDKKSFIHFSPELSEMIGNRSGTQSLWVARQTLNSAIRAVPCLEGKDPSSFTQQKIKIPCVGEQGLRAIISPLTSAVC